MPYPVAKSMPLFLGQADGSQTIPILDQLGSQVGPIWGQLWVGGHHPLLRWMIRGRRSQHRCIPGDIVETTKPLFSLYHNAHLGVGCARGEMQTRSSHKRKPFEFIEDSCKILKSVRCRVAIRCLRERYKTTQIAPGGSPAFLQIAGQNAQFRIFPHLQPWVDRNIVAR